MGHLDLLQKSGQNPFPVRIALEARENLVKKEDSAQYQQ